jgi:serine/threonine-protein kinase
MELLRGETLSERLRRAGAFAVSSAVPLMVQMCRALDAAHRSGVVHGDFKSGNVMLIAEGDSEPRVAVTDFGLARQISSAHGTHLTPDDLGGRLGTPSYMAPERLRGCPLTPASDIFSLGAVLYEMTSGRLPFNGGSPFAIADAVLNYEPPELGRTNPDVPVAFERLVYRMLAKRPEERPQSARAALSEIVALGDDRGSTVVRTDAAVGRRSASVVRRVPSIAVLPFANLSDDKDNEYFSDGLTQELTVALATIEGLKVASRTSVLALRAEGRDVRDIAARLNVDHVLEGSVRKAGNRLRIATQLVAATDGCQLWSHQYERDLAEVFAVQDEIACTIVDTLKGTLMRRAASPLVKRYTEDVEAYNLYLKGRYYWNHRYEGFLHKALDHFKQALDRAPQYALAHAGVADCFNILAFYNYLDPREGFRKAEVAAEKALAIDDGLAEAHASLGLVRTFFDWNFQAGEREFQRAIHLSPRYGTAQFWYGAHEMALGRTEQSLGLLKHAWDADPLCATFSGGSAFMSYLARRYDEGIELGRRTLELDPLFAPAHAFLAWAYTESRRYEEAISSWQLAIRLLGGLPTATAALARTFALADRRTEAVGLLGDLAAVASQRYVSPYHVGAAHAALGQRSEAIAWLERAREDRNNWLVFARVDPAMDPLRDDSRFRSIEARVFEGSTAAAPLNTPAVSGSHRTER